jgi:hypothetical protein
MQFACYLPNYEAENCFLILFLSDMEGQVAPFCVQYHGAESTEHSNKPFYCLRYVKHLFIQLAFQRLAGHVLFTFKSSIKVEAQTNLHGFQNIRQTKRTIEPKMF